MRHTKHNVVILRAGTDQFKKNIGESRNMLIQASKEDYKWAVRIDDDSILDRDYLERLWNTATMNDVPVNNETERKELRKQVGAVGGVVPTYAQVELYKYPPKIFNIIPPSKVPERYIHMGKLYPDVGGFENEDEEYYNVGEPIDDGAFLYHPEYNHIVTSHHLRSSYLFSIPAILEAGGFPSSDDTGFREETIASINLLDKGYKLYTNTQAIAWHLWCPNLGRGYNQTYTKEDHEKKILRNELKFQRNYRTLLRKLFGKKKKN